MWETFSSVFSKKFYRETCATRLGATRAKSPKSPKSPLSKTTLNSKTEISQRVLSLAGILRFFGAEPTVESLGAAATKTRVSNLESRRISKNLEKSRISLVRACGTVSLSLSPRTTRSDSFPLVARSPATEKGARSLVCLHATPPRESATSLCWSLHVGCILRMMEAKSRGGRTKWSERIKCVSCAISDHCHKSESARVRVAYVLTLQHSAGDAVGRRRARGGHVRPPSGRALVNSDVVVVCGSMKNTT